MQYMMIYSFKTFLGGGKYIYYGRNMRWSVLENLANMGMPHTICRKVCEIILIRDTLIPRKSFLTISSSND